MMLPNRMSQVIVIVLATMLAGCGGKTDGPNLGRVKGTVNYRGKPLKNATVVFMPDALGVRLASGITDDSGRFDLMTEIPGDGAVLGKHRVSITPGTSEKPAAPEDPSAALEKQLAALQAPEAAATPEKSLIPVKYLRFETSELTAEVKSGTNTINFDLTE